MGFELGLELLLLGYLYDSECPFKKSAFQLIVANHMEETIEQLDVMIIKMIRAKSKIQGSIKDEKWGSVIPIFRK